MPGANPAVDTTASQRRLLRSAACLQFVSRFTDNNLTGDQLCRAYSRLNRAQTAADDPGLQPTLQAAAEGTAFEVLLLLHNAVIILHSLLNPASGVSMRQWCQVVCL